MKRTCPPSVLSAIRHELLDYEYDWPLAFMIFIGFGLPLLLFCFLSVTGVFYPDDDGLRQFLLFLLRLAFAPLTLWLF